MDSVDVFSKKEQKAIRSSVKHAIPKEVRKQVKGQLHQLTDSTINKMLAEDGNFEKLMQEKIDALTKQMIQDKFGHVLKESQGSTSINSQSGLNPQFDKFKSLDFNLLKKPEEVKTEAEEKDDQGEIKVEEYDDTLLEMSELMSESDILNQSLQT